MNTDQKLEDALKAYRQAEELLRAMDAYIASGSGGKSSAEDILGRFDLLLQAILLHIALADGKFDASEKEFITRICRRGDILLYLSSQTAGRISLSWNDIERLSFQTAQRLLSLIDSLLKENVCDEFVRPLAECDCLDKDRDEHEMLCTLIAFISARLSGIDGDADTNEQQAFVQSVTELISRRWIYFKEAKSRNPYG